MIPYPFRYIFPFLIITPRKYKTWRKLKKTVTLSLSFKKNFFFFYLYEKNNSRFFILFLLKILIILSIFLFSHQTINKKKTRRFTLYYRCEKLNRSYSFPYVFSKPHTSTNVEQSKGEIFIPHSSCCIYRLYTHDEEEAVENFGKNNLSKVYRTRWNII